MRNRKGQGKSPPKRKQVSSQAEQLPLFEAMGEDRRPPADPIEIQPSTEYGLRPTGFQEPASGAAPEEGDAGGALESADISTQQAPDAGAAGEPGLRDPSVDQFCEQVARIIARGKRKGRGGRKTKGDDHESRGVSQGQH